MHKTLTYLLRVSKFLASAMWFGRVLFVVSGRIIVSNVTAVIITPYKINGKPFWSLPSACEIIKCTRYYKRGNFRVGVIFAFFALLSFSRKLPPSENKTHMPLWRKYEWNRENYPHVKCLTNTNKFSPSENNHVYSMLKTFLVVSLHVPFCQRVRIISNRFVIMWMSNVPDS